MDYKFNGQPENRNDRDLLIMLVTKLDNIETLIENLKEESRSDYEDLQARFTVKSQETVNEINNLKDQIQNIKHDFEKKYVSKDVFQPVKAIVYGITGTSLMGILYAILKLVNLGAK